MKKEKRREIFDLDTEERKRINQIKEKLFLEIFSKDNRENIKRFLEEFQREMRAKRKNALVSGKESDAFFSFDELAKFELCVQYCPYQKFPLQVGDLLIEGLKYQQKCIKNYTYEYTDKLLKSDETPNLAGFLMRMLARNYVSKYGWKLIRTNYEIISSTFPPFILKDFINNWAEDELTRKKWEELDKEFGTKFNFVEKFS